LVAAIGLLCGVGAAAAIGATAGSSSNPVPGSREYRALSNKACKCRVPGRYNFAAGGTTHYRYGGTETWNMHGKLYRHYAHTSFLEADYWQAAGLVTLIFDDIVFPNPFECTNGDAIFSGSKTIDLVRNDVDIGFNFRLKRRNYEVFTGHSTNSNHGVHGVAVCEDASGSFPVTMQHRWTGFVHHKGRPLRMVEGKFEYTDVDLYHYKAHWKLTKVHQG
jgi:hypothetical protein